MISEKILKKSLVTTTAITLLVTILIECKMLNTFSSVICELIGAKQRDLAFFQTALITIIFFVSSFLSLYEITRERVKLQLQKKNRKAKNKKIIFFSAFKLLLAVACISYLCFAQKQSVILFSLFYIFLLSMFVLSLATFIWSGQKGKCSDQ